MSILVPDRRWEVGVRRGGFPTAIPTVGVLAATLALVWPAVAHAVTVWQVDEEFSYGFLILPLSLLLILWRRADLHRSLDRGATSGIGLVIASLVLYVLGARTGINAVNGLAVSPLLLGIVAFLWGWKAARVVAFPIGFLAFGLGLYRGLLDSVGYTLQQVTAMGAAALGQAVGMPVVKDGLILTVQQASFLVAEQCSGLSSLLSLLALAAIWTYVVQGPAAGRVGVLLSVLPIVVFANTVRVTAVLAVAMAFGADAATGFFHGASSLVLFGLALGSLLFLSSVFKCKLPSNAR